MPTKTTKKTTARATAHRAPAQKTITTPAPETHECTCGCGCGCGCHGGCKFCRVVKKLIVLLVAFALGFATAKICCCGPAHHHKMLHAHFVNGCLDTDSVKNPKIQAVLPAMDINQDGCITREEYRVVKKHLRAEIRDNVPTDDDDHVSAEDDD